MFGVAAKTLSGAEASQLLSRFLALDRDFSGTVDLKELGEAARQVREGGVGGVCRVLCLCGWGGARGQGGRVRFQRRSRGPSIVQKPKATNSLV